MRSPFKKKARSCTAADARFLFLLLLGREPRLEAELEPFLELSFFGATKRLLLSPTFAQSVLDPFLLGKRPMQKTFTADQANLIAGGAKTHFSIRLTENEAKRWPQSLLACLGADRAQRAFLKAFSPDRLQYLSEHLTALKADAPAIEADIQQTHGTRIEGSLPVGAAITGLTLDLFLNGEPAGSAVAEASEPGTLAFSHTLQWPDTNAPYEAMLSVYERDSGVMICPPREVILSVSAAAGLFARAQAAIEAFEDADGAADMLAGKAWMTSLDRMTDLPLDQYDLYRQLYQPPLVQPAEGAPTIGISLPNHSDAEFEETRRSLRAQTYQGFEVFHTLEAVQQSACDVIVALEPGEELHARALGLIAHAAIEFPEAVVIRFGHDYVREGRFHSPVFVATFDPLIAQQMPDYAGTFAVRRSVIEEKSPEISAADMMLQLYADKGQKAFAFVPEILLTRSGNVSAAKLTKLALPDADSNKRLTIVVPTKDKLSLLKACIESLQATITHQATTEIVIVDNNSEESDTLDWLDAAPEAFKTGVKISVIRDKQPFNWAAINNAAVRNLDTDLLLFLNNDTQALEKGWDTQLRQLLSLPETGAVGAKLLYEDRSIQHAGAILHTDGRIKHEAIGFSDTDAGYQNRLLLTRCCDAVTGAFLACSKKHFDDVGGFDQDQFAVTYNDIDFCLATTAAGRQVVYAADIRFLHLESQSRGSDSDAENRDRELEERASLLKKWASIQLIDAWLPIQLAYDPGKKNLILKRVRKTLETSLEKRQKSRQ